MLTPQAQFNAEELITKRDMVSHKIRGIMEQRAKQEFGMILEDVSLMDLQFGSEFMQAVEAKQVGMRQSKNCLQELCLGNPNVVLLSTPLIKRPATLLPVLC